MRAKIFLGLLLFVGLSFGFVSTSSAQDLLPEDNGIFTYHQPPRWRESESHPIRFLSYIAHPVGWVLREGIFRPVSALAASTRFTRSFMGYREPFDFRNPICFKGAEEIPDCKQVPPYNSIGMGKEEPAEEPAAMVSTERQVFFPDVNFDFDKASLNDLGRGRVRQVAQLLASVPSVKIVVTGHADYMGTDEYNMDLGMRRADTVTKELAELGIDPARMSPVSKGESEPIFTEEEDWARAVNRRAQFTVTAEPQAMPVAAAPAEQQ